MRRPFLLMLLDTMFFFFHYCLVCWSPFTPEEIILFLVLSSWCLFRPVGNQDNTIVKTPEAMRSYSLLRTLTIRNLSSHRVVYAFKDRLKRKKKIINPSLIILTLNEVLFHARPPRPPATSNPAVHIARERREAGYVLGIRGGGA